MAINIEKLCDLIIECVGGKSNISDVANCMTRLRLTVLNEEQIDDEKLKNIDGVLGLVHDKQNYYEVVVGPGISKRCADYCKTLDLGSDKTKEDKNTDVKPGDWKENKAKIKGKQKKGGIKSGLKILGEIFVPLIPGVVTAGLAAGFANLIGQVNPGYASDPLWGTIHSFLMLINASFMTYISAWAGYRATERFGGTPILGGMIGMMTGLEYINSISQILHLDNTGPFGSILSVGRGGVIAALIGAWAIAKVETFTRKHIHPNLDTIFTPMISIVVVAVPYVLIVMPVAGLISTGIAICVEIATLSDNIIIRALTGYISAAVFLPLVAMGLHHSLIAVYTVQLDTITYITLYPALCMAGFGQIGAAIAIYIKARKVDNKRLKTVIAGSISAGILGVGEPLIYGVTLPLGKPFFTAGLGAGFGGALVMAFQCASTSWGPSGILGVALMTEGPNDPLFSIGLYLVGGIISIVMGFVISNMFIHSKEIAEFN